MKPSFSNNYKAFRIRGALLFVLKNYHIIVIITLGLLLILIVLSVFNLSKSKKLSEKDIRYFVRNFHDIENKLNELSEKLNDSQKSNNE